jgi:hypothetical protein
MTCGHDVFDKKQQSRIAQKIHEQLVAEGKDKIPQAEIQKLLEKEKILEKKAQEFKDKLLEYDRTSARRTRVIGEMSLLTLRPHLHLSLINLGG